MTKGKGFTKEMGIGIRDPWKTLSWMRMKRFVPWFGLRGIISEREERIRGGDIGENRATSPPETLHAEVNHHLQYHA